MTQAGVQAAKAPGSEAPSLSVPAVWNSLPRILMARSGPFASFLRTFLCQGSECTPTPYTWPCPVPYPEAFESGPWGPGVWRKRLISVAVAQLSYLNLGRPSSCPPSIRRGVPLNAKQRKAVRNLEHMVFGSSFSLSFSASDYGRIAQKVEGQARVLETVGRAAEAVCSSFAGYIPRPRSDPAPASSESFEFQLLGELPGKDSVAALPVVANSVKLPAAPAFAPQPFMDSHTCAMISLRCLSLGLTCPPRSRSSPLNPSVSKCCLPWRPPGTFGPSPFCLRPAACGAPASFA